MIPYGFDPQSFKTNQFIIENGLSLIDYTDDFLMQQYEWVCINIGQNVIQASYNNAVRHGLDGNISALWTAQLCLAQAFYIVQENLISGGIAGANKGVEGLTYMPTAQWKQSWTKTAYGELLAQVLENTPCLSSYNSYPVFSEIISG